MRIKPLNNQILLEQITIIIYSNPTWFRMKTCITFRALITKIRISCLMCEQTETVSPPLAIRFQCKWHCNQENYHHKVNISIYLTTITYYKGCRNSNRAGSAQWRKGAFRWKKDFQCRTCDHARLRGMPVEAKYCNVFLIKEICSWCCQSN